MKCEIIRDLLPVYIDKLTSEESNREIEAHMKGCEECRAVLKEMETEIQKEEPMESRNIQPFRKVNQKMKKVIQTAVVCCLTLAILAGAFVKTFIKGWAVSPQELQMEISEENGYLGLNFELTNGRVLNAWGMGDSLEFRLGLKQMLKLPGDDRGESINCFEYGIGLEGIQEEWGENWKEYPVTIDYGKEIREYTIGELLEMAEQEKTDSLSRN